MSGHVSKTQKNISILILAAEKSSKKLSVEVSPSLKIQLLIQEFCWDSMKNISIDTEQIDGYHYEVEILVAA